MDVDSFEFFGYTGLLDTEGLVRLEGIDPGMYEISFPRLEVGTWRRLG